MVPLINVYRLGGCIQSLAVVTTENSRFGRKCSVRFTKTLTRTVRVADCTVYTDFPGVPCTKVLSQVDKEHKQRI